MIPSLMLLLLFVSSSLVCFGSLSFLAEEKYGLNMNTILTRETNDLASATPSVNQILCVKNEMWCLLIERLFSFIIFILSVLADEQNRPVFK